MSAWSWEEAASWWYLFSRNTGNGLKFCVCGKGCQWQERISSANAQEKLKLCSPKCSDLLRKMGQSQSPWTQFGCASREEWNRMRVENGSATLKVRLLFWEEVNQNINQPMFPKFFILHNFRRKLVVVVVFLISGKIVNKQHDGSKYYLSVTVWSVSLVSNQSTLTW